MTSLLSFSYDMRIEAKSNREAISLQRVWIRENYMTSISFKLGIVSSTMHIYPSK